MNKSSDNPDQKLPQLLGQDAVVPFSTIVEQPSSERTKADLTILMFLLQSLTEHVMSGDVMALSVYKTIDYCELMGMDGEEVTNRLMLFLDLARKNRSRNPLSKMF